MLYDENDLMKCFEKVEAINFHQTIEVDGVKFSCHHAGHVLGGAMFNIEISGVKVFHIHFHFTFYFIFVTIIFFFLKILYTGDYSREEDRHLPIAEFPTMSPHVMICESTYGKQTHEPLEEREFRFTSSFIYLFIFFCQKNFFYKIINIKNHHQGLVREIVSRGGRCLIPVFASGRAQELLLILGFLFFF